MPRSGDSVAASVATLTGGSGGRSNDACKFSGPGLPRWRGDWLRAGCRWYVGDAASLQLGITSPKPTSRKSSGDGVGRPSGYTSLPMGTPKRDGAIALFASTQNKAGAKSTCPHRLNTWLTVQTAATGSHAELGSPTAPKSGPLRWPPAPSTTTSPWTQRATAGICTLLGGSRLVRS